MQTRKRAKSIMFGKKTKEKKEEHIEEPKKEKVVAVEPENTVEEHTEDTSEKTAEKAAVVERRVVPEKPHVEELSSTLPHAEEQVEAEDASNEELASDTSVSQEEPEEEPKETEKREDNEEVKTKDKPEENQEDSSKDQPEPVEIQPESEEPHAPVTTPSQAAESQELSSTLPPSAFTIQEGESPIENKPEEKKRVGVYFFVIAFLAFILGLGAMAAVSYLGLINPNMSNISKNIHMPALLGAKPTPTSVPTPTTAPTAKPVDLQTYTIAVLNGSGVTGAAGKTESSLNSAGFKVASTGNADRSDYTKTEISVKKSVDPAYLTKLEDELNKSYVVDTTVGTSESSSTSDVTVIIGTQTAQ